MLHMLSTLRLTRNPNEGEGTLSFIGTRDHGGRLGQPAAGLGLSPGRRIRPGQPFPRPRDPLIDAVGRVLAGTITTPAVDTAGPHGAGVQRPVVDGHR